jgi:hypothetical protein
MTRSKDIYAAGSTRRGPYPFRTEIDLRQEFNNMFDGVFPEMAKAQNHILRKYRRNYANERLPCACLDKITQEPDRDVFCPICHGDGYLWDEVPIQIYRKSAVGAGTGPLQDQLKAAGILNIDLYSFWFKSSVPVTLQDKLVTMALDEAGSLAEPLHREELWRIGLLLDLRSDDGRLEFWQAYCYAEKRTFLNGPVRKYMDR